MLTSLQTGSMDQHTSGADNRIRKIPEMSIPSLIKLPLNTPYLTVHFSAIVTSLMVPRVVHLLEKVPEKTLQVCWMFLQTGDSLFILSGVVVLHR